MASIKFGAIVTDMRGKLGGHVFQKGNQSRVMKTNRSPRKTNTEFNNTGNVGVARMRSAWAALSFTVQNQFRLAAANFPQSNKFNDVIVYSGYQFFLFLNGAKSYFNMPLVLSVTGINNTVLRSTFTGVNINQGSGLVTLVGSAVPAGQSVLVKVLVVPAHRQSFNPDQGTYFTLRQSMPVVSDFLYELLVSKSGAISPSNKYLFFVYDVNAYGFRSINGVFIGNLV